MQSRNEITTDELQSTLAALNRIFEKLETGDADAVRQMPREQLLVYQDLYRSCQDFMWLVDKIDQTIEGE